MKKIPMRKCVITGVMFPKKELIRVVKTPNGEVVADVSGKINGHGAYLQKSLEVLEVAKKKKTLEKVLGCSIPEEVYLSIARIING